MLKIEQPLSIADRRSILFSARMRYASEIQPVREVAVDKIVEQNLLLAEKPEGLSLKELQQIGADSHISHFPIFNEYELQRSLERSQTDFPTVFAKAIQQQLLPQESFFDIREFIVFSEMDWATKELPAEDVEDCIKYIRRVAPGLNPSESADREKLAHEVNKFFVDPGRKFKAEIEQLEAENREAYEMHSDQLNQVMEDLELLRLEVKKGQKLDVKRVAQIKGVILSFIYIVLFVSYFVIAILYGSGQNPFQKILSSWQFLLSSIVVLGIVGSFWVGKSGLKELGIKLPNLFSSD